MGRREQHPVYIPRLNVQDVPIVPDGPPGSATAHVSSASTFRNVHNSARTESSRNAHCRTTQRFQEVQSHIEDSQQRERQRTSRAGLLQRYEKLAQAGASVSWSSLEEAINASNADRCPSRSTGTAMETPSAKRLRRPLEATMTADGRSQPFVAPDDADPRRAMPPVMHWRAFSTAKRAEVVPIELLDNADDVPFTQPTRSRGYVTVGRSGADSLERTGDKAVGSTSRSRQANLFNSWSDEVRNSYAVHSFKTFLSRKHRSASRVHTHSRSDAPERSRW